MTQSQSPSAHTIETIAVTGATGHVGNVLVRTLNARGITPRAFVRRTSDQGALAGAKYDAAHGDVGDLDALTDAFRGCDTVIHCAAIITISERHNPDLRKTNVEGTRNVLTAAERAGVKRLVYVSSVHALTEPVGAVELNEDAGFDENLAHGAYGKTKAAASSLVQKAAREGRLDTVLVLPTGIIGPNDYRLSPQGKMIAMVGRGMMPLTLAGGYHWVDVRDVCEGALAAHAKGRSGEAYLLDAGRLEALELGQAIQEAGGKFAPFAAIPLGWAKPIAKLSPLWERFTHRDAILTPYSLHTLAARYRVSAAKAQRELGWKGRDPRIAFGDAWRWLRDDPKSPLNRKR
ncbi:MAG: NAD-dependent epimerase/dehydratase family protein [Polyangiales bacterium]